MRNSFADNVRQHLMELTAKGGADGVTNAALALSLDLVSDADKRPMYMALRDLIRTGEVERLKPGVHIYRGKCGTQPEIRERMWAVVRMRKTVSIDDLQELAGASRNYAEEFIRMLARRQVVQRIRRGRGYVYRLIADSLPMPENDEKSARLRRIREAKKRALEEIDAAGKVLISATQALVAARMSVADIPEEEESDGDDIR